MSSSFAAIAPSIPTIDAAFLGLALVLVASLCITVAYLFGHERGRFQAADAARKAYWPLIEGARAEGYRKALDEMGEALDSLRDQAG